MSRKHIACVLRALTVGMVLGATWRAGAGDLNPPAGPILPTMKPLDQVEPRTAINATNTPGDSSALFKITQPGSYFVTANITGVSGKGGIEIAASDVTLDLNGFRLLGVSGSLAGIFVTGGPSDIEIRNGIVRSWGANGLTLSTAVGCVIEDVRAVANTGHGMQVGPDAMVRCCYATSNTQSGILASTPAVVSDCLARGNGATGITTGDHAALTNCVAAHNTSSGLSLGAGALVRGCIAAQNSVGVTASSGLNAVDSIARNNSSHGFFAIGASFVNCLSTVNTGDGFHTDAAIVANCRSTGNSANGYALGTNSQIVHSIAVGNTLFGALLDSGYVLRNLMAGNSLNNTELREIRFSNTIGGRADGNHLIASSSSEWGITAFDRDVCIGNSISSGFVPLFGGTGGPDISSSNIDTECNPNGNYYLP